MSEHPLGDKDILKWIQENEDYVSLCQTDYFDTMMKLIDSKVGNRDAHILKLRELQTMIILKTNHKQEQRLRYSKSILEGAFTPKIKNMMKVSNLEKIKKLEKEIKELDDE